MPRKLIAEMVIAKARAASSRSKALREVSRKLNDEAKALVQTTKRRAMNGELLLPSKPGKQAT